MSDYKEYFEGLADEYGVDICIVKELAELLGEDEYYDGLLDVLEEIE